MYPLDSSQGEDEVSRDRNTPTFSHVVFMTRRFEEMKAWYINVFGAEVVHGDPALAFLTYDEENHRFAIANLDVMRPDVPADSGPGEIGVNHIAYTYTVETCSSREAFDFMRSEAFADNPVGIDVDPDALLERHRAGASEAELTARPVGQPSPIPDAHGMT